MTIVRPRTRGAEGMTRRRGCAGLLEPAPRRAGVVLAVWMVWALSGCASARLDTEAAVESLHRDLPSTWVAVPDSAPVSDTPDAAPLSTSLLALIDDDGLRELVAEALEANPNLRAAARRLAASRRLLRETGALRWPFIEARYTFDRGSQGIAGLVEPTTQSDHRVAVNVAWEIDVWQRLADLDGENVALTRGQAADVAAARDALGAQVIQGWVAAVSLRRAIAVEEQRVEVLERLQETIQRRYRLGLGSLDDLAAARSSTELSRANLAALENDHEAALRALELLLGRTPRAELLAADTLPAVAGVESGYPAAMLARRHDVAVAWWRLEAADAATAAAAKARWPGLRLTGDLARGSSSLSDLLSSGSIWNVIGSLTQPVFRRGLLKARADARRLELEAAWEDYRATVLRAVGEVEDALGRERSLLRQRDHLTVALEESTRNLEIFKGRYRRGLASILELLQAEDQEMNLRRQVIAVAGEALSNRITLALALGARCEE